MNNTIIIDKEKCIGCGLCVKDCVASAIKLEGGKAEVFKDCIECGHCFAVCPQNAVDMKGTTLLRHYPLHL